MRIAIDARELVGKPTGVGRYLRELLLAWTESPDARRHEFILCAPAAIDLTPFTGLRVSAHLEPGGGTHWEQLRLPGILTTVKADVLFAPAYTSPIWSPVPVVLTIHDVSFAAHPEWFSWREGARRRTITRMSAERARNVITVSEFSKRELVTHLGLDPWRVSVIYSGVTRVAAAGARTRAAGLDATAAFRHSVLYVGSIFTRRHVPETIDGFARLAQRHPELDLDIVGDNRTSPKVDIDALARLTGLGDRIRIRSYISDLELAHLYDDARGMVFLSDYEGFGLTPIEALGAGVPILVLDTPISREIYGDAALYVARAEPTLIAAALERLLFDQDQRAALHAATPDILARYTWARSADLVLRTLVGA